MKSKFNEIAEQLQAKIDNGEYTSRLPSEQDLARDFGTTNNTVRKALDLLLQNGNIVKVPYIGTFVSRKERKTIRIFWFDLTFPEEANALIKQQVREHFPDYDIVFSTEHPADPARWNEANYDLIRIVGSSNISYSDCTSPLPLDLIAKYRNEAYFSMPFDVHRINNFFYALPILFSPALLRVNRELLKDFPGTFGSYELNWDLLLEIAVWAERKGYYLWPADTAATLLHCLVFSGRNQADRLYEVDFEEVRRAVEKIRPLYQLKLIKTGAADPRDTICWWTCRQNKVHRADDKRFGLVTFPVDENGTPLRTITPGEFLLLSSQSQSPDEALKVAEYFLSPEIQRIIGKYKIGMPVFKAAAIDSLDSCNCRDDLYLNETRRLLTNSAQEQGFMLKMHEFSGQIRNHTFSIDLFLDCMEAEIQAARDKEQVRLELLKNIFNLPTELAVSQ